MQNGWVKLHVQTIENPIWRKDRTAWQIFEYLLFRAYTSRPQNKVVTSRQQVAEMCSSNNSTVYKAFIRLRNAKMITTKSTNKDTTISICNWHKYQTDSNNLSNNKVTTKEQQSNTLNKNIEYKNKENIVINNNISVAQVSYGNVELNQLLIYFEEHVSPITSKRQLNRYALSNLLKKHGKEKLETIIRAASAANEDRYAPTVTSPLELQEKLPRLAIWARKQSKSSVAFIS